MDLVEAVRPDWRDWFTVWSGGALDVARALAALSGVDAVTLGGSISANAHGRGLLMQPIGDDIESMNFRTFASSA